jgi:hypothetical protein
MAITSPAEVATLAPVMLPGVESTDPDVPITALVTVSALGVGSPVPPALTYIVTARVPPVPNPLPTTLGITYIESKVQAAGTATPTWKNAVEFAPTPSEPPAVGSPLALGWKKKVWPD